MSCLSWSWTLELLRSRRSVKGTVPSATLRIERDGMDEEYSYAQYLWSTSFTPFGGGGRIQDFTKIATTKKAANCDTTVTNIVRIFQKYNLFEKIYGRSSGRRPFWLLCSALFSAVACSVKMISIFVLALATVRMELFWMAYPYQHVTGNVAYKIKKNQITV